MMGDLVQQKLRVPVKEKIKLNAYIDGFQGHLKLGVFLTITNSVRKSDVFSAVIRTAKSTTLTF